MNIVWFILGLAAGFLAIIYSKWITDSTYRIFFAEKWLGNGGTYIFWKIVGVLLILLSFWILFS